MERERKRLRVIEKSGSIVGGNGRWKSEIRKEKLRWNVFVNREKADRKKFCNFWINEEKEIEKMEILLENRKWYQKKEIEKKCKRGDNIF